MTEDEMKNKYTAFVTEISEILGLGKPVDIIKLCATTDLFFRPLEKRIAELEQEVLEVRQHLDSTEREWGKDLDKQIHYKTQFTKAKEIINNLMLEVKGYEKVNGFDPCESVQEAEQFLKETKE